MKKHILPLFLALTLIFVTCVSATARYTEVRTCHPKLSFQGASAICKVEVETYGNNINVDLTMSLYPIDGGQALVSWPVTRTGTTTQTFAVTIGEAYTLTITGTVSGSNGTDNIDLSVSAECS